MLGTHRRTALTLRVAGYSYREIQQLPGVTYTWVDATSPTAAGRSGAPRPTPRRRIGRYGKPPDSHAVSSACAPRTQTVVQSEERVPI
jgi:hypothetical protein